MASEAELSEALELLNKQTRATAVKENIYNITQTSHASCVSSVFYYYNRGACDSTVTPVTSTGTLTYLLY